MPVSRKDMRGGRSFMMPLFGIFMLLCCYFLLSDWHNLPSIISATLSTLHWPG